MQWSRDGREIIVAGGDNSIHIINPRSNKEIYTGSTANSSPRAFRAIFSGDNVISIGFARSLLSPSKLMVVAPHDKSASTPAPKPPHYKRLPLICPPQH
jgi:hypothetical protein